ncbi:hypothetical protein SAMN05216596_1039 [Pseudomonas congelans]|uniref:Uncharacterized protein n=1 Tax=Pseudomonas congelans TaxID=200452 RepID=A0A1H0QMD4_9PSED|nr:hypothetical protein [Pseudomonas sp. PvP027]SDP17818.1 hypothetical protein SAMN05216596_1039 [Pseudomonas congelans]
MVFFPDIDDSSRTPIYLTKKNRRVTQSFTNCITTLERGNDRCPEDTIVPMLPLRPIFGAYLPGVSVRRCLP